MSDKSLKWLGEFAKIVVETDQKNPASVATITHDCVDAADGYRVRLTPVYAEELNDDYPLGGNGSLP